MASLNQTNETRRQETSNVGYGAVKTDPTDQKEVKKDLQGLVSEDLLENEEFSEELESPETNEPSDSAASEDENTP